MRQNHASYEYDERIAHVRRSGFAIDATMILVCLLGFLSIVSSSEKAFAYATAATEGKNKNPAVDVSKSGATNSTVGLFTPKRHSASPDERKIVLAHAIIVKTSPPQGGVASGNIGKVDVWYDAGIRDSLAALAVISSSGERIDKRDAAIDSADSAHVSVNVNPMPPGKYTVRYRALSADGHMVSGAWEFDVQP
jgi:methionine-rich copper-binding protein CopC